MRKHAVVVARGAAGIGAIPLLLLAWLLRPLIKFRLCVVGSHRFGHLALEPEMRITSRPSGRLRPPIEVDVWSLGSRRVQSNVVLGEMWSRRLRRPPSWVVGALVRAGTWVPWLALERPALSIHGPRNGLDRSPRQCPDPDPFTARERSMLLEHDFDVTRPYVALVVRDAAYYAARGEAEDPHLSLLNTDLSDFIPACRSLAASGIQVVRLGGPSKQNFPDIPGCFDYANSPVRSAELDVKLPMSCRFAIATQTGPDSVALLARRPVLYVNVLRFSQFFFGTRLATWFPVRFVEAENQRPWSLAELAASPLLSAKDPRDFAESGVVFLRASADEVSAYVADYVNELENGADQPTTELRANVNRALQQHMRPWGESRFGEIVAKMSRKWLVDNQSWWLRNG